jgi:hypothetical protein
MNAVIAFTAMFVLDFVWARYTMYIQSEKKAAASMAATLIVMLNGTVVLAYVTDPWMLIPACLGAFLGTYLSFVFPPR